MYKSISLLDNFGFLWYHARVKLGCFATALSDLTGRKASQKKILTFAGNGARKRLFPPFPGVGTVDPASPATLMSALSPCLFRACRKEFSAENGVDFRTPSAEIRAVRLPGSRILADAQERFEADIASVVC